MNRLFFDKTNIQENYPGVTSPITYSFVKNAYSNVYRNFVQYLGVNKPVLDANTHIFDNMLAYVNGHIYYNLTNWYDLLKFFPNYDANVILFENMLDPENKISKGKKFRISAKDILHNLKPGLLFLFAIIFTNRFYKKFDQAYAKLLPLHKNRELKEFNDFDLVNSFKKVQSDFFKIWVYAIINDFRVMVFFGITNILLSKTGKSSVNIHFLSSQVKISKPNSLDQIMAIANIVKFIKINSMSGLLNIASHEALFQINHDEKYLDLRNLINEYINKYGHRVFNELQLENDSIAEKPEILIDYLKIYSKLTITKLLDLSSETRASSLNQVDESLPLYIKFLYKITLLSIYKREEFRLRRSEVFGIARKYIEEFGNRLIDRKLISSFNDIYLLYIEEVYECFTYHRNANELRTLIAFRSQAMKDFKQLNMPTSIKSNTLFEINFKNNPKISENANQEYYECKPTSSGYIESECVVMNSFNTEVDLNDKILITTSTDPGWTILFPMLSGIIIETGGVLSHASVVAREFNIPCVILENSTSLFKTGDKIIINTEKGIVQHIK